MEIRAKKLKRYCLKRLFLVIAFLLPSFLMAQTNLQVGGIVTDSATGETLIGVTIVQKGTTNGTITDLDGHYSISVPKGSVLEFRYMGYTVIELEASASRLDVKLVESSKALDEVIVIGYGTQRKADVTTAVATVSSDEWANRPIMSAQQALQGKAAGVQVVQPSGKPGVKMQMRVRGSTSLNAGNEPLYVVDGIPTNDISNIAPGDIMSMNILKDASAASIYGVSGANGVVIITTKKGEKGNAKVEVSMYAGFSNVTKQIKTLNTKDYYDLMQEIGISVDQTNNNYTNWAKEMYGTGFQQNYQVSLSGGTDKTSYYLSGGYQNEKGVIAPAEYDRYSFRSNINSEVKNWLTVKTNLSFARNNRMDATDNANSGRGGVVMSILNTPPFMPIWDPQHPNQYATNPFQASWENPFAQANAYDRNRDYRFMGNLELDFTILKDFHFRPSLSVDYTSHEWDKFLDPIRTSEGRRLNGKGENAKDSYLTILNENIVTYATKLNDKHNLNILGGVSFQRHRHNNTFMSAEDFVKGTTFDRMTLNMANKINSATSSEDGNSKMSLLSRLQYDYMSKYLLTASFRYDGSSKLYHKWDYFPSASFGWRLSSEEFFKPLTHIVDDAKLRLSWGRVGNDGGIGNYDFYDKFKVNKRPEVGEGPSVSPDRLGNRDLKWESTSQYNAGIDLTMFNSRLTAEFDYYYKKTSDLLLFITLPASAGVTLPMRNDGEMLNKGFEFNINGQILTGAFKWDAGLNMSFNKNELSKLGLTKQFTVANIESNQEDVIMIREGLPLGSFFGYFYEGVDSETGLAKYKDLNNNGRLDPADRGIIGNAQPDFTYGLTNNFSWKNLTLSTFIQGSYGNDIFNASRIDTEGMFDAKNQTESVLLRWRRPGMITSVPKAGELSSAYNSTRFVEDGSYIRLKSVTLNYSFGQRLISKFGFSKLNVYGTVNNLLTLSKYRGYDPELSWSGDNAAQLGIDMGTYPQTRSFVFGLNITF